MHLSTVTSVFLLLATAFAAPVSVTLVDKRATSQCGQYQSESQGAYTLSTNGWGWSSGTGSQCSEIDSLSGNTIAWSTTWTWNGTSNRVKSYTNVQKTFTQKQLSAYTSMPITWNWTYVNPGASNVAVDTFVGASATGANTFEVMIWLGLFGGISPLSANGYPFTPIATTTINGVAFDLAYGLNGNMKVYSFVAHSHAATSFTGDLLNFYNYLATNYASNGFTKSLYLQQVQAGTEVFTGTSAKLTTTAYSIAIN